MLFALRQPGLLLGLAIGFLLGSYLTSALAGLLVGGVPAARCSVSRWAWLDPFGVVAALIGGIGWGPRPTSRFGRPESDWRPLAASLVGHAVLAAAGLAGFRALTGEPNLLPYLSTVDVLHGSLSIGNLAEEVTLGIGVVNLGCGLLSLVPIPPLELGVLLWTRLPTTPRSRQLAYRLTEENWGVAVLLVLLLLPLAGEQPLLLYVIGLVADPILHAV